MQESLSILVVTNTYPTAEKPGDTPQIRDQIEALRARGVEVELLYVDRYQGRSTYARAARRIAQLSFGRGHYHLIHAYYGHCGLLARMQFKYPIVVTFLGSDLLHPRDGTIGKLVARLADGVIVQSEEMKRIARRDDAHVIPLGVNLQLFTPCSMDVARRELGLAEDAKLVLFPWNPARAVKRFDVVQAAIRIIQENDHDVQLIALFDRPHEVVAKYMNACNVMVLASDHEGAPMAMREAMACNLPIVSVDVGDVRELIAGTDGCYLCRREPADMADKVRLALARGGRTCGERAVRHSDALWGAEQMIRVYASVLKMRNMQNRRESRYVASR